MSKKVFLRAVIALVVLAQLVPLQARIPVAQAATVDIANGDVASLKNALTAPNPPHIINLAVNGVYSLTTVDNNSTDTGPNGFPIIDRNITINGNGAIIGRNISAADFRFFVVTNTGTLNLYNVTFRNGKSLAASGGGAIANLNGFVNIVGVKFENNQAGAGAAISNRSLVTNEGAHITATLTISKSLFSSNTTQFSSGGAIVNSAINPGKFLQGSANSNVHISDSTFIDNQGFNGGAILNGPYNELTGQAASLQSELTIVNSTFWSNQSGYNGGAISSYSGTGNNDISKIDITNSTFANNSAGTEGGAISLWQGVSGIGTVEARLRNTLFSNNTSHTSTTSDKNNCFASSPLTFTNGVNNLEYQAGQSGGAATCGTGSNLTATAPLAASPANNGGPTPTISLTMGSPAKDAGDNTICADPATVNNKDQRGINRPQGTTCDIGALEVEEQIPPTSLVVTNTQDNVNNPPAGSLRQRLLEAANFANPAITFDAALGIAPQITLTGNLLITGTVSIQGNCTNPVKITAQPGLAVSTVSIKQAVSITGLEFSGLQLLATKGSNSFSCSKVYRN